MRTSILTSLVLAGVVLPTSAAHAWHKGTGWQTGFAVSAFKTPFGLGAYPVAGYAAPVAGFSGATMGFPSYSAFPMSFSPSYTLAYPQVSTYSYAPSAAYPGYAAGYPGYGAGYPSAGYAGYGDVQQSIPIPWMLLLELLRGGIGGGGAGGAAPANLAARFDKLDAKLGDIERRLEGLKLETVTGQLGDIKKSLERVELQQMQPLSSRLSEERLKAIEEQLRAIKAKTDKLP
jgi:hypothetical protein